MTSRSVSVSRSQAKRLAPMRRSRPGCSRAGEDVDLADEIGDEGRRRVAVDLHRRADLLDHALVHDDDPVGDRERLLLVVRDHDGGDAELALQRADLLAQVDADDRVERRQRLVEQQQAGRGGERPRQRDPLLLAAGELGRELGAAARQADQLQQLLDPGGDRRLRHLAVHQAVGDVVGDREVGKERVRLEDDAVVALGRRQDRDVAPGLEDAAGGLRLQAGDDAQQRRLAAAGGAEEADELALARSSGRCPAQRPGSEPNDLRMPCRRR